jgi:hypothetical protein
VRNELFRLSRLFRKECCAMSYTARALEILGELSQEPQPTNEINETNEESASRELKPPLGSYNAGNLAAKFSREHIAKTLERLQDRAAEPSASPLFAQLVADYIEILAAKDKQKGWGWPHERSRHLRHLWL